MKEKRTWWKESVVYQIYPRSFKDSNGDGIGDINGIRQRLDYLKDLGIDAIWLSPVYQSPNDDNGYDISDYQSIMSEFGTMEDFEHLLAEAHDRDIKVVMDLVVNHTSDEHRWFMESRKSKDNAYRDYYIWKEAKDGKEPNNWHSCFGGSAWQWDEETGMYYLHMFSKKQPDLNWENEKVRQSVFDMMTWWGKKGIDGFRMDAISMISKVQSFPDGEPINGGPYGDGTPYVNNGPRIHEYLQEMNEKVISKYDWMTVGEGAGVGVAEALQYAGFDTGELNMMFHFEHVNLGQGPYGKWWDEQVSIVKLKEVMTAWQDGLEGKAWNSLYWDNHDQPRVVSRFGNDSEEYREVSAKMLATCLHMMKGTPYIYQGEELGMTNARKKDFTEFRDIEIRNAYRDLVESGQVSYDDMLRYVNKVGRDNARYPMHWDDTENAGFTTGTPWIGVNPNYVTINAQEQVKRADSVYAYYKQLIALRHQYDIVVYGQYQLLLPESESLYVYERMLEGQKLLVICNFTQEEQTYELPAEWQRDSGKKLLIGNYAQEPMIEGSVMVCRPYEAVVYAIL